MIQTNSSNARLIARFDSQVAGVVAPGHGIASGKTKDPRFPHGTIHPQIPHFAQRGLRLEHCFPGTLNVDISPYTFSLEKPSYTFRNVNWHPQFTEHFSFCHVAVATAKTITEGYLYYPHPETKIEFIDRPTQLQILAPKIPNLQYDTPVTIYFNKSEFRVTTKR